MSLEPARLLSFERIKQYCDHLKRFSVFSLCAGRACNHLSEFFPFRLLLLCWGFGFIVVSTSKIMIMCLQFKYLGNPQHRIIYDFSPLLMLIFLKTSNDRS